MQDAKPATRRRHDADLKARVLEACAAPGASVARVAMAHGLNANLVHKWRRGQRQAKVVTRTQASDDTAKSARPGCRRPKPPSIGQRRFADKRCCIGRRSKA